MNDQEFAQLAEQLERLWHLDLTAYKPQQMRRRVSTFVSRNGGDTDFSLFLRRVQADAELQRALRDMVTINVTEFFRDTAQWTLLERDVLPSLVRERPALRIWSAGCSYGQEAISLAIALDRAGALDEARILATDFDRQVLARARAGGPYRTDELSGLAPDVQRAYFRATTGGAFARPEIMARLQLRELNLLRDRFEGGFDLIACRNVMIYFEPAVRSQLVARFKEALRPGGVLFIGATEALLGADADGFKRMGGNFYSRAERARIAA